MALSKTSILRHKRWSDASLSGINAPANPFVRDSGAYQFVDGYYVPIIRNILKSELVNGRPGLLIEPASEQEIAAPFNFADASWSISASLTRANAISCIRGQVASKFTNTATASASVGDGFGTWIGSEAASFIIEHGNYDIISLGMYSVTSGWVYLVDFNFTTQAVITQGGSGVSIVIKLSEAGPNGGRLYRVVLRSTGTSGHSRYIYCYPTSYQAVAAYAYVHYMGWEENFWGSNPISGPASTPLNPDQAVYLPVPAQHLVHYLRWTDGMTGQGGANRAIHYMGLTGGNPPLLYLYYSSLDNISAYHSNGTLAVASSLPSLPAVHGAENEAVFVLLADGQTRLLFRRDQGTIQDGGLSGVPTGGLVDWGANALVSLGHIAGFAGDRGRLWVHESLIVRGGDFVANTGTGTASDVFREVETFARRITNEGEVY